MTTRREVGTEWIAPLALSMAGLFAPALVQADSQCPIGMVASRDTCCDIGTEYVASKNQCMVARPERRCLAGHFDDCVIAGKELEDEGGMGANYASELYRFACEEGHAPACRGLGAMYRAGKGLERDDERGRELYQQACQGGDAVACTQVAQWMLEEHPESRDAALGTLKQACHRGDANGCMVYAAELEKDPTQSVTEQSYLTRACEGGVGAACRGLLDHERKSASVTPGRELELLGRACSASDAESCLALGNAFRDGLIAPQSSVDAAKRYRLACDAGHAEGCLNLAELTVEGDGVLRDLPRAAALFGQLCVGGNKHACDRKSWVEGEQRREHGRAANNLH